MKSVRRRRPSSASKVVASTFDAARYERVALERPEGPMRNQPPLRASSRRQKRAGLSKRGQQHQSMEPSLETSAAVWPSPMSA
jgi:hypothetical protein